MERANSHRTTTGGGSGSGGEFFICFTARLSSSSTTRIPSSKSLMSPGRTPSLGRRLRSSGSIKGAQSPMFPSSSSSSSSRRTKGGAAFEPAEPSSPKVTCIGQVRVKSKKKKNINGAAGVPLAPRSHSQREVSFRRERECLPQQQRNIHHHHHHHQSWVYQLPLSICEALRSIGSEVNCFVPCRGATARSPCSGKAAPNSEKRSRPATSLCGAVFARWLMAIEEERDEEEVKDVGFLKEAKAVEILEIDHEVKLPEKKDEFLVVEEEEGRVSVCIPPRNALLLMRCRSDPARVAALADRFWGSPSAANAPCQEKCGADEEEDDQGPEQDLDKEDIAEVAAAACSENAEEAEEEGNAALDGVVSCAVEVGEHSVAKEEVMNEGDERMPSDEAGNLEEGLLADSLQVVITPLIELKDDSHCQENEAGDTTSKGRSSTGYSSLKLKEGGWRRSFAVRDKEWRRHSFSSEQAARRHSFSSEREARRPSFLVDKEGTRRWSFSLEKEELTLKVDKTASSSPSVAAEEEEESKSIIEVIAIGAEASECVEAAANKPSSATEGTQIHVASAAEDGKEGRMVVQEKRRILPDCLLQMMYEPKLSMEVSKETWVCSTDFLRWRPHHPQRPSAKVTAEATIPIGDDRPGCNEDRGCNKRGTTTPAAEVPVQPPTPPPQPLIPPLTPPAPSIVSTIEKKCTGSSAALVTPLSYGPVVLTRCNSEPVRSSASLAPDACFWKNQHHPIGVDGIGFVCHERVSSAVQ